LRAAISAALSAGGGTPLDEVVWPDLLGVADGSVRRAITFSALGGTALHERVVKLLGLLPRVDWPTVHSLSDELAPVAAEAKFDAFFDILFAQLGRAIRARAAGAGEPRDLALATRLIKPETLPRWVDTWSGLQTALAEGLAINIDRKTLVLAAVTRLEATARA
jgi:hypothetical protein